MPCCLLAGRAAVSTQWVQSRTLGCVIYVTVCRSYTSHQSQQRLLISLNTFIHFHASADCDPDCLGSTLSRSSSLAAMQFAVNSRSTLGYSSCLSNRSGRASVSTMSAHRGRSGRLSVNAIASAEQVLKTVSADNLSNDEIKKLLQRPRIDFSSILNTVRYLQQKVVCTMSWAAWTWHKNAEAVLSGRDYSYHFLSAQPKLRCVPICLSSHMASAVMQVSPIVEQVRQDGDAAVQQFTERFDRVKLDSVCVATQVCAWWKYGKNDMSGSVRL